MVSFNMKLLKALVITTFLINPSVVIGENIEKFANKLFNHYEYDDKINQSLKSFFSFRSSKAKTSLVTKNNSSNSRKQNSTQTFKIKSKNKIIYSFGKGQSLQINPSNINNKIIYNNTHFSYFEVEKDAISYGFSINF